MSEKETSPNDFVPETEEETGEQSDGRYLPEVGEIPDDWNLVTVEDVSDNLLGGGTPSKSEEDYWGGNIPWASVKDLNGIELSETEDYITESGVENSATNVAPSNSIIISTRMTVGEPFLNKVEMAINQDMKAIIPNTKRANPLFLVYSLWDKDPYLKSLGRGTTVDGITTKDLSLTHFGLPSLEEQRKIASVLYTVDQAIQKTEEIIGQTEQTQKGIIRRLFRRGASNEATETHEVLGEIPMSWEIVELSDIAEVVMGSSPNSKYYNESGNGMPFYQGNNDFNRRNPKTNVWCTEPVKQAKKGDILISIRAPVGDLNVATEDCCIGRGLAAIRPQSIDFDYLYYHLYERNNWFTRISSGSTFDSINSSQLKNLKIKLPPESTQEKIGTVLKNNENCIMRNENYLNHLRHLKQGLMQDLLSGEVRTDDKDIELVENVVKHG